MLYWLPIIHKKDTPYAQFPAGVQLHMGWPRSWLISWGYWWGILKITSGVHKHLWTRSKLSDLRKGSVLHPAISIIKHTWNRTYRYTTELPCPYITSQHCWSSAIKHISFSKISILNRYLVQPWVHLLVSLWPTCSWKSLKSRPSTLPPSPPRISLMYVDDTFVTQKAEHSHQFLQHLNAIHLHTQFVVETPNTDGCIPFLDNLVSPGPDNTLPTALYRKHTHTDQY